MREDLDWDTERELFCKSRRIWDYEKKCATRFVINKLKTITVTHPDGYKTLQNVHDGFTIKRPKLTKCRICFEELSGNQREYCSYLCRVEAYQRRQEWNKLQTENNDIVGISWSQDPNGKPQRKDIIGHFNKNGKYYQKKNIITKKSGKPRSPKNESKYFSKGKDY